MMAANYRHIGDRENRLGRHYSRFSPFWPTPALSGQSLDLRKLCDAGSNRRSQVNIEPWKSATAIKVNPDSPQRPLRAEALRRGITVFVPTPRLRDGFEKLDPRRIPPD